MLVEILHKILFFILLVGIIVTIHEFGHFIVARMFNVRVITFSIGFGRQLFKVKRNETTYALSAIPLGGYVKMLESREENEVSKIHGEPFDEKPIHARAAIVLAGPLANLLLSFVLYFILFMSGVAGPKPIVGEIENNSIAMKSGLPQGSQINAVNGTQISTWEGFGRKFTAIALDKAIMNLTATDATGRDETYFIDLSELVLEDLNKVGPLAILGIQPAKVDLPNIVDKVYADSPAQIAGLQKGDRIIKVDQAKINNWRDLVSNIQSNPGKEITLTFVRDDVMIDVGVTPESISSGEKVIGRLGVSSDFSGVWSVQEYNLLESLRMGLDRTAEMSYLTIKFLLKLIALDISTKTLSGPISIADYAGESAEFGILAFLNFMALISISIGIINLLPIPMLDGGHLLYYFIEALMGRPMPDRIQQWGIQIGLVFMMGLFVFVTYNDLLRVIPLDK